MTNLDPDIETTAKQNDRKTFFQLYGKILLRWSVIAAGIIILLVLGVDKKIIAFLALAIGLFTKAFVGLGALISLVPVVGPLVVKVFTIPFFWILNALGYFVSVVAIKKGYSKEVVNSRVLTIALLIGVLLGYILGNLLPIR